MRPAASTRGCRYVQVCVKCPLDLLIKRDLNGLCKRVLFRETKHFTGISDPSKIQHFDICVVVWARCWPGWKGTTYILRGKYVHATSNKVCGSAHQQDGIALKALDGRLGKVVVRLFGQPEGIRFQLARETVCSFALKGISACLGFLCTILLARLLGAEGYGVYAYVLALITLMALPAHAGLPNLIVRETAKGLAQERPDLLKGAWQWAGRVVAVLSPVVMLVAGPVFVAWQGGLGSIGGQTMAWALPLVPLIALGNLRGAALRGLQRVVVGQLPEFLLRPGLFLLLLGGTALLWGGTPSPSSAMMLYAVAAFLAFAVGAWLLWRHTPEAVRYARPSVDARGWLASSVIFALLAGFRVINIQASTVVLGLFVAPHIVGHFRVAAQVAMLAAFGLQAINMVLAPRFADLWARREKARLQRLVTRSAQAVLAFNLLVTVALVLAGRSFFQLVFGPEFDSSYVPLLILLVGQMVNSAAGCVDFLLNMTGHERDTAKGMAVAAAVNVVLNVALVPVWGIVGAATATAASMTLWNVLLWWRVRQRLGINSLAFNVSKRTAV